MTVALAVKPSTPWWLRSNAGLAGLIALIGVVYLVGQLGEFFSRPGSEEEFLIGNYYLRP